MTMTSTPSSLPGIIHHYSRSHVAFEHVPSSPQTSSPTNVNTLLFVGGLYDGLLTAKYTKTLALRLPTAWRFVQPLLSSSYRGWGTSSLNNDVDEIGDCINYILALRPNGKIVLMGHSTGCQDIMHYLLSPLKDDKLPRPHLAGAIMQAGCSDREAFGILMSKGVYDASVHVARLYVHEGRGEDVLPAQALGGSFPGVPICARRWLSLASPPPAHDGEDDYFSSDFGEDRLMRTFGRIGSTGTPMQILYSEKDQYVPETVDKIRLLERWRRAIEEGGGTVDQDSGIIKGADHTLDSSEGAVADMVRRVIGFLDRVEKGA